MKNTLILDMDNNASCECIQQLADNTNRVFVEMYSIFYEAPTFNLIAGSVNTQLNYTKEDNVYKLALPDTISQYDAFKLSVSDKPLSRNTEINFKCSNLKSNGNMLLKKENGYYLLTAKITESIATVNDVKKMISDALLEKSKQEKPIGHIEFNTTGKNPNTYLGFGTWVAWGSGRVPVGVSASDENFNTTEKTGGTTTHVHSASVANTVLNANQIPKFYGDISAAAGAWGATAGGGGVFRSATGIFSATNAMQYAPAFTSKYPSNSPSYGNLSISFGGGGAHNHGATIYSSSSLQPYITCYMWKRTA